MFMKKFNYDPEEKYTLRVEDNPYLGDVFGLKISCGQRRLRVAANPRTPARG